MIMRLFLHATVFNDIRAENLYRDSDAYLVCGQLDVEDVLGPGHHLRLEPGDLNKMIFLLIDNKFN